MPATYTQIVETNHADTPLSAPRPIGADLGALRQKAEAAATAERKRIEADQTRKAGERP